MSHHWLVINDELSLQHFNVTAGESEADFSDFINWVGRLYISSINL